VVAKGWIISQKVWLPGVVTRRLISLNKGVAVKKVWLQKNGPAKSAAGKKDADSKRRACKTVVAAKR
jgi:hypothetical protein